MPKSDRLVYPAFMGHPSARFAFDSELVVLQDDVEHDTVLQTDPFAGWEEEWAEEGTSHSGSGRVASGSQSDAMSTGARMSTVVDPLTTSLLAEVSRRRPTAEIDRNTLEAALDASKKKK